MKSDFMKFWTTEYSLLSVWLFGRQYIESCRQELGFGFNKIFFVIEGDLATIFRSEKDQNAFMDAIIFKINQESKFKDVAFKRLLNACDKLVEYSKMSPKKFLSHDEFSGFLKAHDEFLPYFLVVFWFPDKLKSMNIAEDKKKKLFQEFEQVRKKIELVYPKLEVFFQKMFIFVAKKEKIEAKLLRMVLPQEWSRYIDSGELPKTEVLEKRYDFCVIKASIKNNELILGDAAIKIAKSLKTVQKKVKEAVGMAAFKGVVSGRVRLVFSNKDLLKVKKGDVMVTTMTRPEWLTAMKLAAAYVTDAGGILCHAAIVARELKKPCVIGTKVATEIFHDGDLVEVDADKGMVRIIK